MATRLKLFAGLLVIICIVGLVQMAPAEDKQEDESFLEKAQEGLKKLFDDDNAKQLMDTASKAFGELAKTFETQFNQFKDQIQSNSQPKN